MRFRQGLILAAGLLAAASAALWRLQPARAVAAVAIPPFLQSVQHDRAVIVWAMTGRAPEGVVEISSAGEAWRRVPASRLKLTPELTALDDDVFLYRAEVSGLSARSSYLYRVLAAEAPLAGTDPDVPLSFHTPGAESVRFLAFGDSGDGSASQARLARLIGRENVDFGLHTGDLAYPDGSFEQFRDFHFAAYAGLLARVPLFTTPGNHDCYTQDGAVYRALLAAPAAPPHYSFDWGPVHVTVIDTNSPLTRAAYGDQSLRQWLEADLAAATARWRIAVFHHTPYPLNHHKGSEDTAWARRILTPILEEYGVRFVLNGHEHLYMRSRPLLGGEAVEEGRGVVYVTTGGGGAVLHPAASDPAPFSAFERSALHYVRIAVEGRELKLQAVGEDGEVFDEAVLTAGLRRPRRSLPESSPPQ